MISAWKEDSSSNHLPHDAPNRPDVHIFCVAHAKDNLSREVGTRQKSSPLTVGKSIF